MAGDACIPLEFPPIAFPGDLFDSDELTPELLDCLPLTGFELPVFSPQSDLPDDEETEEKSPSSSADTTAPIKEDPFLFFNNQNASVSNNPTDSFINVQVGPVV